MVRWKKLRKICSEILGRSVQIYGSTNVADELRAAIIDRGKDPVEIVINLNKNKSENEVVQSLAHELSHLILKNDSDNAIGEKAASLYEEILKKLEVKNGKKNTNERV